MVYTNTRFGISGKKIRNTTYTQQTWIHRIHMINDGEQILRKHKLSPGGHTQTNYQSTLSDQQMWGRTATRIINGHQLHQKQYSEHVPWDHQNYRSMGSLHCP